MQKKHQLDKPETATEPLLSPVRRLALTIVVSVGLSVALARWDDSTQRLVLCLCALALLWATARSHPAPRGQRPPWRGAAKRQLVLALWAPLALTAAWHAAGHDLVRFATTPRIRVWNVFHYYLGAEYFGEVGYLDLYDAALLADQEADDYWRRVHRVRDQSTYLFEPRDSALGELARTHFTPQRWRQFQQDLAALQPQRSAKKWRSIFIDRGYNASPFWSAVIAPLTHILPARRPGALKALCSLDLLILGAIFILIARTFGATRGWLALLLFALSPVDRGRIVGGFLQYDWLLALTISVCALRQRKSAWAAASLAYATLERVFPLLFAGSLLLPAIVRWVRSGRLRRDHLRFGLLYATFMLVGLGIGCLTPRGPAAWPDFFGNILHHGEHHTFGEQRVGLKHLMTHRITSSELEDNSTERRERFAEQETLYRLLAALLLLGWFAAVHRRYGVEAFLLGLVPFFALLVSSRYYWSCLLLVPLVARGTKLGRRSARAGTAVLVGFGLIYLSVLTLELPRYGQYLLFDLFLLVGFTAWIALLIRRELRYRTRRLS